MLTSEHSKIDIERAIKKVQIAIDKMIDLNDMGFGCYKIEEILTRLRSIESHLEN